MARSTVRLPILALLPGLMLAGCEFRDSPDNAANESAGNDVVTVTQNVRSPDNMSAIGGADVDAVPPANAADTMLMNAQIPKPVAGDQGPVPGREARETVQRYYAFISAGQYEQAQKLWEDGGKASGRTPQQFAQQFEKYSSYQADIGEPQNTGTDSGDRTIEVPVTLHGTLRGGASAFRTKATLVLHRAADGEGAGKDRTGWHIARIDMPQGATGG